jgi:rod shape-determining protein MreC
MRLAVPIKAIGQRFALPVLVFASVAMIVLGKADALLFDRLRTTFGDIVSPALGILSEPVAAVDRMVARARDLIDLYDENGRLRQDNVRLMQWQQAAQQLSTENARLRDLLKLAPEPSASFVSARVIANSGGTFVRSILVAAGTGDGVTRGQAAVTGDGLVGRVTETGERASRVLLITDLNSRIPVAVGGSRERAVLAGDNSSQAHLIYLPGRSPVAVGDRVVTSGNGGVFPPDLPVGIVAAIEDGIILVEPYAELSRLDYVRIVNYGLEGVLPQPVIARPAKPPRGASRDAP